MQWEIRIIILMGSYSVLVKINILVLLHNTETPQLCNEQKSFTSIKEGKETVDNICTQTTQ